MGDPAGIGAEIIVKALANHQVYESCRPLVIGDAARLTEAAKIVNSPIEINPVSDSANGAYRPGLIDCVDLGLIQHDLRFGVVSPAAGEAAFRYVEKAASLAVAGAIDAICTAPLSKEAMHAAGHRFPGHTELLAYLTGMPEVSMMLAAPGLRVVHVTTHIGLIDAIERIEPAIVERTIDRGHAALVSAGIEHSTHRCLRHQSARGRERTLWTRRRRTENSTRRAKLPETRVGCNRSSTGRYSVLQSWSR